MPEGDTIHRTAIRLRPALVDQALVRFEARRLTGDRPRLGERIGEVEAVGKHLLIHFERGLVLQTHMRMSGSWHLYRAEQRWQQPAHLVRAVVGVEAWTAVCFSAPIVRTFVAGSTSDPTGHLGPDLCLPDPDLDMCIDRMSRLPDTSIAEVLLDQRIANGVGNVFKSEVLWACGVSPFASLSSIDVVERRRLLAVAAKLLQANLGGGARSTVPGGGLGVYGLRGRPCRRCGTPIEMRRHGDQARSTYWCPRCQR